MTGVGDRRGTAGPWPDWYGYAEVVRVGPLAVTAGCTAAVDGVVQAQTCDLKGYRFGQPVKDGQPVQAQEPCAICPDAAGDLTVTRLAAGTSTFSFPMQQVFTTPVRDRAPDWWTRRCWSRSSSPPGRADARRRADEIGNVRHRGHIRGRFSRAGLVDPRGQGSQRITNEVCIRPHGPGTVMLHPIRNSDSNIW